MLTPAPLPGLAATMQRPSTAAPWFIAHGKEITEAYKLAKKVRQGYNDALELVSDSHSGPELVKTYKQATGDYRTLRERIRAWPLPGDFDRSAYKVSFDELQDPARRAGARQRLSQYADRLGEQAREGRAALSTLDRLAEDLAATATALRSLTDAAEKAEQLNPAAAHALKLDWSELELGVRPELQRLASTVGKHRDRIAQGVAALATAESNLRSMLALGGQSVPSGGRFQRGSVYVQLSQGEDAPVEVGTQGHRFPLTAARQGEEYLCECVVSDMETLRYAYGSLTSGKQIPEAALRGALGKLKLYFRVHHVAGSDQLTLYSSQDGLQYDTKRRAVLVAPHRASWHGPIVLPAKR